MIKAVLQGGKTAKEVVHEFKCMECGKCVPYIAELSKEYKGKHDVS